MKPEWKPFDALKGHNQDLPFERRYVLLIIEGDPAHGMPPRCVMGFLRFAAGDKNSPMFITPGCNFEVDKRNKPGFNWPLYPRILFWADCLGDDFTLPDLPKDPDSDLHAFGKQVTPKKQGG